MKSKIKRLLMWCIFLLLIIWITGCGDEADEDADEEDTGVWRDPGCGINTKGDIDIVTNEKDTYGLFDPRDYCGANIICICNGWTPLGGAGCRWYPYYGELGDYYKSSTDPNKVNENDIIKRRFANEKSNDYYKTLSEEKGFACKEYETCGEVVAELYGCYFDDEGEDKRFDWENEEDVKGVFYGYDIDETETYILGKEEKLTLFELLKEEEYLKKADVSYLDANGENEGDVLKRLVSDEDMFEMIDLMGELAGCFIYLNSEYGDMLFCEDRIIFTDLNMFEASELELGDCFIERNDEFKQDRTVCGNFNVVSKLDNTNYDLGFPGYQIVGTLGFIEDGAILITFEKEDGYETLTLSNKDSDPKGQAYFVVNNQKCLDIDPQGIFLSTIKDLDLDTSKLMESIRKSRVEAQEKSQEESQEDDMFDSIAGSIDQEKAEKEETAETDTTEGSDNSAAESDDSDVTEETQEGKWVLCEEEPPNVYNGGDCSCYKVTTPFDEGTVCQSDIYLATYDTKDACDAGAREFYDDYNICLNYG